METILTPDLKKFCAQYSKFINGNLLGLKKICMSAFIDIDEIVISTASLIFKRMSAMARQDYSVICSHQCLQCPGRTTQ